MPEANSLQPAYFEKLYAQHNDPWNFRTSSYEHEKYSRSLDALPRTRYLSAFEAGCSIGVLTTRLALRCDHLVAVDGAARPLEDAREACAGQSHVEIAQMVIPVDWPEGRFDLMIFSEILYYFTLGDLDRCVERVKESLLSDGDVLLVHYTLETNYPLSGDEAAEAFGSMLSRFSQRLAFQRHPAYRLDLWRRDR